MSLIQDMIFSLVGGIALFGSIYWRMHIETVMFVRADARSHMLTCFPFRDGSLVPRAQSHCSLAPRPVSTRHENAARRRAVASDPRMLLWRSHAPLWLNPQRDEICFRAVLRPLLVLFPRSYSSASPCTKGFAISSLPSTGLISTSSVPRATRRPSGRVEVFPSSSVEWISIVARLCYPTDRLIPG